MTSLVLAALAFVGLHLAIPGTPLRGWLVGAVGEAGYRLLFSLGSVAALGWMIAAFGAAPAEPLWDAGAAGRLLTVALMPLATLLLVAGMTSPSPTGALAVARVDADSARGVLRVTRHPVLMAIALWAALHLMANGEARAVVLFASLLLTALAGAPSIDRRRARQWGEGWRAFAAVTSVAPFAAILAGRNRLALGEIGGWRIGLGLLLYALLLGGHRWAFGVSPLAF